MLERSEHWLTTHRFSLSTLTMTSTPGNLFEHEQIEMDETLLMAREALEYSDDGSLYEMSDEDEAYLEDIDAVYGRSKKKQSKCRTRHTVADKELSPEVEQLIAKANEAFINNDLDAVVDYAEQAIMLDYNATKAYALLAAVYQDKDEPERVLKAKVAMLHLDKKNKEGWIEVAALSHSLGYLQQAIEFYGRACILDEKDYMTRLTRAALYMESHQDHRAYELLRKVRKQYFAVMGDEDVKNRVIFNMANCLSSLGRSSEAMSMYEDILKQNLSPNIYGRPDVQFDFLSLNVLAQLYYNQRAYSKAVRTIKNVTRWLLGRHDETFWEEIKDDSEYDDRRLKNKRAEKSLFYHDEAKYALPIDLRVRLLLCRLQQSEFDEARIHLRILMSMDAAALHDLYTLVGNALEAAGLWNEALAVFRALETAHSGQYLEGNDLHIARCLCELGHTAEAEELYQYILEQDKNNIEAMVALAEIYGATNRNNEAKDLIDVVHQLRQEMSLAETAEENHEEPAPDAGDMFISNVQERRRSRRHERLTRAQKIEAERVATNVAEEKYRLLLRYKDGMEKGNPAAIHEWMRLAGELVTVFTNIKKFFPADKSKVFTGLNINRHKKSGKMDIDERLQQLSNRLDENALESDEDEVADDRILDKVDKFRGISFDDWFDLFMQYALCLAKYEDRDDAYSVLRRAKLANVFHLDDKRDAITDYVYFACAYISGDFNSANDISRQYILSHQFHNDAFRLYCSMLPSGTEAIELFNGSNNQKFFLRQVKAVDSLVQKRSITGQAKITDTSITIEKENPLLLVLYAHIMLVGRSYVPSWNYLMKASSLAPNDTMILLSTGLVHIQRALQRQTLNRHLQIIQGFSYLLDYFEVRKKIGKSEEQEANYNLGRTFHILGLTSLALPYYNRVLEMSAEFRSSEIGETFDYACHAAYNLHLIYTLNGNGKLARHVVDKYLVI